MKQSKNAGNTILSIFRQCLCWVPVIELQHWLKLVEITRCISINCALINLGVLFQTKTGRFQSGKKLKTYVYSYESYMFIVISHFRKLSKPES